MKIRMMTAITRFEIQDEAEEDLREIIDYYAHVNDTLPIQFNTAVATAVEALCLSPVSGTKCRFRNPQYKEIRRTKLNKPFDKYLIFFRHEENVLQIIRIIHSARNYGRFFRK